MTRYKQFEDLPVWQEAELLYKAVLDLLEGSPEGLSYGFRNQLDRASLSVSNNIAEGFERMSTAQLLSFLETARGSAGEVGSMGGSSDQATASKRYLARATHHQSSCRVMFEADWRLDDVDRTITD